MIELVLLVMVFTVVVGIRFVQDRRKHARRR
jgi:hypothetical protein